MRNHLITDELIIVGRRDWQGLADAVSQQRSLIQRQQDLIKRLEQKIAAVSFLIFSSLPPPMLPLLTLSSLLCFYLFFVPRVLLFLFDMV